MADCGLALIQAIAQSRNVQFLFAEQIHQNLETSFVCQEFEDLNEVAFELFG